MAAFHKFDTFVADLGLGKHHLDSDALNVALTNAAPLATDAVLADLTEITPANGYAAGGSPMTGTAWAQVAGVAKLAGSAVVFTASAGAFGPLQYAVLYNATAAGGPLIGWWDYESSISITDTNTFTLTPDDLADVLSLQ